MKADDYIMAGQYPPASLTQESPMHSYYWDCRAEGLTHEQAAQKAAQQMGSTLASIQAVQR